MSSPSHIHSLEDEHHHLPTSVDEALPYIAEEEEEPIEEEPIEEEPIEEEPMEEEPSEEESEETQPPSPITHPSGPRLRHTPSKTVRMPQIIHIHDPYLPPSSPTIHQRSDARRWNWIPDTLDVWRQQEGNPYSHNGESSRTAQVDPVTREPSHHTIALLIARTVRHENQLEQLEDSMEALPYPEFYEEVERDTDYLARSQHDLRQTTEELRIKVDRNSQRLTDIERRMDGFEARLEKLSTLADIAQGYANHILRGP